MRTWARLGFGIYAGLAVYGLIVLLEEAPQVFTTLQIIGCALLVWYGWSMWNVDHGTLLTMTTLRVHKASLKASPLLFSIQKLLCFWWRCWPKFSNPT